MQLTTERAYNYGCNGVSYAKGWEYVPRSLRAPSRGRDFNLFARKCENMHGRAQSRLNGGRRARSGRPELGSDE